MDFKVHSLSAKSKKEWQTVLKIRKTKCPWSSEVGGLHRVALPLQRYFKIRSNGDGYQSVQEIDLLSSSASRTRLPVNSCCRRCLSSPIWSRTSLIFRSNLLALAMQMQPTIIILTCHLKLSTNHPHYQHHHTHQQSPRHTWVIQQLQGLLSLPSRK